MDDVLREIDNSEDYVVFNGRNEYNGRNNSAFANRSTLHNSAGFNSGDEERTYKLNLTDVLEEQLSADEGMSELEHEYMTSCDRCGAYIGFDKWDVNYYNSTRSPGLCESCTRLMDEEFRDRRSEQ